MLIVERQLYHKWGVNEIWLQRNAIFIFLEIESIYVSHDINSLYEEQVLKILQNRYTV